MQTEMADKGKKRKHKKEAPDPLPRPSLPTPVAKVATEPVMCRLCKGRGVFSDAAGVDEWCCLCKGQGQLDPADVDEWTFVDMDEPLGPGAIGNQPRRTPYVPPTAEWNTWMDDEDGRGYLWAELRVPEKK